MSADPFSEFRLRFLTTVLELTARLKRSRQLTRESLAEMRTALKLETSMLIDRAIDDELIQLGRRQASRPTRPAQLDAGSRKLTFEDERP